MVGVSHDSRRPTRRVSLTTVRAAFDNLFRAFSLVRSEVRKTLENKRFSGDFGGWKGETRLPYECGALPIEATLANPENGGMAAGPGAVWSAGAIPYRADNRWSANIIGRIAITMLGDKDYDLEVAASPKFARSNSCKGPSIQDERLGRKFSSVEGVRIAANWDAMGALRSIRIV
jgi:hypothetical protein